MKLDVETARELAYGRPGEVLDDFMVVANEQYSSSRWSLIYNLIILKRNDSTYWETQYSVGATEIQDEKPFEYDYSDEIEFYEVEPYEVVIVRYRKVA